MGVDLDGNGTYENNEKISYDDIGNTTKYLGNDLLWTGRELYRYQNNDFRNTYYYDSDGLRSRKNIYVSNGNGGYTYNGKIVYQYLGGLLTYQCTYNAADELDTEMYFFYDSYNKLIAIRYIKGTTDHYYYVTTNMHGDVLGIYSASGALLASYDYDAWGNCTVKDASSNPITSSVHIGNVNPIRYRSYYYDTDTGLYYLQSRYYDATIGRFINADEQLNDDIIGNNPFAYCSNNPVSRKDDTGQAWWCVIGAVVGGLAAGAGKAISNVWNGKEWYTGVVGAVAGGIVGGAIASTGNVLAAAYAGAAVESLVNECISYTKDSHLSGSKQKAPTAKNLVNSALSVGIDTAVNGTISYFAGEMTQNIVPKMVPDPAPMASVSFLSLETLQLSTQSLWDMTLINTSEYVGNQLPQGTLQTQTIQIFPNEYVEGVA